jgi:hypothetical protein
MFNCRSINYPPVSLKETIFSFFISSIHPPFPICKQKLVMKSIIIGENNSLQGRSSYRTFQNKVYLGSANTIPLCTRYNLMSCSSLRNEVKRRILMYQIDLHNEFISFLNLHATIIYNTILDAVSQTYTSRELSHTTPDYA